MIKTWGRNPLSEDRGGRQWSKNLAIRNRNQRVGFRKFHKKEWKHERINQLNTIRHQWRIATNR